MPATREEVQAQAEKLGLPVHEFGVPPEVFQLADVTRTPMSQRLREISEDPMWVDHCEIRKSTLLKAAREAEEMAAAASYFRNQRDFTVTKILELEDDLRKARTALTLMGVAQVDEDFIRKSLRNVMESGGYEDTTDPQTWIAIIMELTNYWIIPAVAPKAGRMQ